MAETGVPKWYVYGQHFIFNKTDKLKIGLEQFKPKGESSQEKTEWVPWGSSNWTFVRIIAGQSLQDCFGQNQPQSEMKGSMRFEWLKDRHMNRVDLRGITVPSKEILIYRLWIRIYATPSSIGKPIWICFFLKISET